MIVDESSPSCHQLPLAQWGFINRIRWPRSAATTRDVQLGKMTINWKQRQLRFLHLVLAIENTPVLTLCSAQLANGAQMEHRNS